MVALAIRKIPAAADSKDTEKNNIKARHGKIRREATWKTGKGALRKL